MTSIAGINTRYTIVKVGDPSKTICAKDVVVVHALGEVADDNGTVIKKFWSTRDPGQSPFQYQAGVGGVITGWDQGCLGMAIGEIRELNIPGDEGYGVSGFPAWGIPPNGRLKFTIECLKIN